MYPELIKHLNKAIKEQTLKIGADPEIFLQKDGKIVSAHDIVPGTKEEPFQIDEIGTKVLSDGIALEFNIEPATTQEEFNLKIDTALKNIEAKLPPGVTFLKNTAGAFLEPEFFNSLPLSATELGCIPDFNATNESQNVVEEDLFPNPFRCVAGHIHIGWLTKENELDISSVTKGKDWNKFKQLCNITKALDFYLGLPWFTKDPSILKTERMSMYGNIGAFRPKPYGLEYRVPSNQWLWNPEFRNEIFPNIYKALSIYLKTNDKEKDYLALISYLNYSHNSHIPQFFPQGQILRKDLDKAHLYNFNYMKDYLEKNIKRWL